MERRWGRALKRLRVLRPPVVLAVRAAQSGAAQQAQVPWLALQLSVLGPERVLAREPRIWLRRRYHRQHQSRRQRFELARFCLRRL